MVPRVVFGGWEEPSGTGMDPGQRIKRSDPVTGPGGRNGPQTFEVALAADFSEPEGRSVGQSAYVAVVVYRLGADIGHGVCAWCVGDRGRHAEVCLVVDG